MEDALGCRGVAVVVGAIHGQPDALDLTASRRLALRAREGGRTALLWRPGAPAEPTAALTRFAVSAAPSAVVGGYAAGVGRAAFTVDVEKNRDGRTGHATLAWDPHDRRFTPHAAPSVARFAAPFDRSAPAPGLGGAVLAWPGGGSRNTG
jgi:protein ImuA